MNSNEIIIISYRREYLFLL